jgi:hypothetical protein
LTRRTAVSGRGDIDPSELGCYLPSTYTLDVVPPGRGRRTCSDRIIGKAVSGSRFG